MHYTVAEHYAESDDRVPIEDERQFDSDLRGIFVAGDRRAGGGDARMRSSTGTTARSYRESRIGRVSRRASCDRSIDHLARRAGELDLRVGGLEASTLIELTAFGTAVVMNHRYTHTLRPNVERRRAGRRPPT